MKSLLKLNELLRPYWLAVTGALLSLLGITAAQLVMPSIIRQVIDVGLGQGEIAYLVQAALMVLGLGVARGLLGFVQRYLSEFVSMRVAYDLRNRLYDHIQRLSFTYHDHAQTGQLMSRCTEDVSAIRNFVSVGVVELIQIALLMAGTLTLMLVDNPRLALIGLLPFIPLVLVTTNFGGRASKLFYAVDRAIGDLSAHLQENVTGVQVVRAFAREPHEIDRFEVGNRRLYDARVTVISEWSKVMPTTNFLVAASTILILWFGGQMVIQGTMTVGQIVQFNSYLLLLAGPAQQLTWFVNSAGEAAAGVRRVFEVFNEEATIASPPEAVQMGTLSGRVEFRNVSFRYQGVNDYALQDIGLTVEPNQVIGLIGATGSGKTTLVNLIPRFYDATEGTVLVDGHDVRTVDLVSLRRQVGIVLQTSLLFSASIRANIAFGRPEATEEQIVAAAKAAQAHDFIQALPEGYETIVGERGITLSGGQRQRIAIARALLIDPRILILDDSTSSVDTETEHLIQQALDTLMEGRTTFVIAQRVASVRGADLILVMEDGRIAERGVHADLLQRNGLYRQIYDLQLEQQDRFEALGTPGDD